MRILLIRPPAHHTVESEVPKAVEAENFAYPPLNLLVLATWLKENTSHHVEILDAQTENLSELGLEDRIRRHAPDVVGMGVFTVQLVDAVRTIRSARRAGVPRVVLGGPHVNDFPHLARELPGVDAVVWGEGQRTLGNLLDEWEAGRVPRGIPGLLVSPEDELPPDPVYLCDDPGESPIPDRTMVDYRRYRDVIGQGGLFTTMVASRGCPYQCTFCNTPRHRFRAMAAERVCDEIQSCLDLGISEIYFVDDTFNITNERVHALCDEVLRRGLRFTWTVRMRVNGVDRALLERMKQAGCGRIQFGVEQGTQEGLDSLKKGVTLDEIESAFRLTRQVGINTVAYFLVGTPVERTREDVLSTIRYACDLDPDFAIFNVLTPFPGTPLFQQGVDVGVLQAEPWDAFMRDPRPGFQPSPWDEHFSREELRDLLHLAYRRFYWRPRLLLRTASRVRRPGDLMRKGRAAFRLLTEG